MIRLFCLVTCLCLGLGAAPARAETPVLVFAAASLGTALDAVVAGWRDAGGGPVTVSFAGSSVLARQILNGAPADVFISANPRWMDVLERDGMLAPGTRRDLLSNRLVLIGPAGAPPLPLASGADLAGRLGDGPLAMALVEAVPAGIYGRAALDSLGLWDGVASRVAQTDNVRAALRLVASGEAPLGVVYATDAAAEPAVTVLATFPPASHPPILYPAARIAGSEATGFLDYLAGDAARAVFDRHGFLRPEAAS